MYRLIKRFFDVLSAMMVMLILSPFLLLISLIIVLDSRGGAFYRQERIGLNQKPFYLIKFRSMRPESDLGSKITIGKDPRITKIGAFIRKYKIDELPQLFNIVKGEMSVVGPRPEVKQYVDLYSDEQLKVLSVKPGLTDFASIKYFKEQEILGQSDDPQSMYVNEIMPAKLTLNLAYVKEMSFSTDLIIILKTVFKIFK